MTTSTNKVFTILPRTCHAKIQHVIYTLVIGRAEFMGEIYLISVPNSTFTSFLQVLFIWEVPSLYSWDLRNMVLIISEIYVEWLSEDILLKNSSNNALKDRVLIALASTAPPRWNFPIHFQEVLLQRILYLYIRRLVSHLDRMHMISLLIEINKIKPKINVLPTAAST